MTHSNAALRSLAVAVSAAQQRCRLAALSLITGGVLLALSVWIATPLSASARSRLAPAGSRAVTIDVIAKTTSFRALPGDGFIATGNLFDKRTGRQVGRWIGRGCASG